MKAITIRELHAQTGRWVRAAERYGQIIVTDNGKRVAKLVPEHAEKEIPYFARRTFLSAKTKRLIESGTVGSGGTDSTDSISEDRQDRA